MSDLAGYLIGGGCLLLSLVLGIVLLTGRGSFLIAGYNTSTPEEKARYNEKALCRAVGIYLIVFTLLMAATFWAGTAGMESVMWALIAIDLASLVPFLLYINTSKRIRPGRKTGEHD